MIHWSVRVCLRLSACSLCLHTCCMNCSVYVCVCACVCACASLHNRLAPTWGSKSIIPATFTCHFTELHVQCKQRLSLHANERCYTAAAAAAAISTKTPFTGGVAFSPRIQSDTPDYQFIPKLFLLRRCQSPFRVLPQKVILKTVCSIFFFFFCRDNYVYGQFQST